MKFIDQLLTAVGVATGIFAAWYDCTTKSDDGAMFTLMFLIGGGALAGFGMPGRPWRWALGVGIWMPAAHLALNAMGIGDKVHPDTFTNSLLLIAIATVAAGFGALTGSAVRKGISGAFTQTEP